MSGGMLSRASRELEAIELRIGPVRVGLEMGPASAARLRQRYGAFVVPPATVRTPARLRLTSWVEDSRPLSGETPRVPSVRLESAGEGRWRLSGDCAASLDLASGQGALEHGDGFIGMDTLVRLSLSLVAPTYGWLVLHGAVIDLASGGWALLLGRSGAGKSTAARAFVSHCDEWALGRPEERGAVAASTPYWNGRPGRAPCRVVVCLERAEQPASKRLHGRDAIRALSKHVVRHVARDRIDRYQFAQLCALAGRVPVLSIGSRSGDTYPGELGAALASFGFAPRSNEARHALGGLR
jgi:hypothetical protein